MGVTDFSRLPSFDSLENKKRFWVGSPASTEEGLGMLRYLSPAHVADSARSEIITGERVCLNWDMKKLETPGFGRDAARHIIKSIPNYEGIAWDDEWHFNPQAGSQWDGFRHFSTVSDDGKSRVFYGGTTSEEINDPTSSRISIGHWAQNGIASRGFLIDYVSYAEKKGIAIDGLGGQKITLDDVHGIARECHIDFKAGDVFFLRCGFTKTWEAMTMEQKLQYRTNTAEKKHKHSGLEQSERVVRFLWENHIVAVAGDGVSFEVRPNQDQQWDLHHILLAGWGVPIGEMFDLERLAELCKRLGRWTFFLTSSPLNHPQAVSSTPNCMAIF
ncbi:hypothetical protein EDD36DRAFT_488543 [Exophiala viscosa]|uniref:Cyclase n=1 Tax=Exophiala viscosa TaxID=2486360 RepID=A0AAN6DWG8_9EURO|nr:hypothetical protein EDD36DRAFT_488543 [Exophiala viscosa]